MDALADRLMRGPRGRRFVMELLTSVDKRAREAVFFASRAFSDNAASFGWAIEGSVVREPLDVSPVQAADALGGVAPMSPTPLRLLHALRVTTDVAMYWQAPEAEEALASRSELDDPLAHLAAVVADAPASEWLDAPVALNDQHRVRWPETESLLNESGTWEPSSPATDVLARWGVAVRKEESMACKERPADPHSNWSGSWWSTPPHSLASTTRSLGEIGPRGPASRGGRIRSGHGADNARSGAVEGQNPGDHVRRRLGETLPPQ